MNGNFSKHLKIIHANKQEQLQLKFGFILIGLACIIHLSLGASFVSMLLGGLVAVLSLHILSRYTFFNIGAVLIFLVGFRYVGFPLFIKLGFGEALDKNLWNPVESFGIVLVGFLAYLIAFQISSKSNLGRPFLQPVSKPSELGIISFISAIIGFFANLAVAFRAEEYTGITVSNFFVSFIHLSLISAIARSIQESEGKRVIDRLVIFIIVAEVTFAVVRNSRMTLMDVFFCFIMTIIAFGAKINWRYFAAVTIAIVILANFLTPTFLYVRSDRDQFTWTQKIEATVEAALNWPATLDYYMDWSDLSDRTGWSRNYYPDHENMFQRVSHINNVDMMKSGTEVYGYVGSEDLQLALKRALPRFLAPDKPEGYSQGFWLFRSLGISDPGPYPNAPLIGTGYVAFGWIGAFMYPFVLGLIWLLLINKICGWNLHNNIWTIYMLLRVHNQFVEGSSDVYLASILREMPQDLVILWLTNFLAKGRFLRTRAIRKPDL